MPDIRRLSDQEKMFLAGCIKSMILADGQIDEEEILDLEKITTEMHFDDFEAALEDFEDQVRDEETFWAIAKQIGEPSTQGLIIKVLFELSIQEGYSATPQEKLLHELKDIWKIEKAVK